MRKLILFSFILLSYIVSVKAQQVTLAVHQYEPILISSPFTEANILQGDKIVLGKDILITGGRGNYQKAWSSQGWTLDSIQNTVTVAPSDTTDYRLKVLDESHCSVEQLFRVNVVSPLQMECKTRPVTCFGGNDGMASLTITGGAPPYSVEWSNGATSDVLANLAPGDYSVSVTDQMNQQQVKTITITAPAQISKELYISICQGSSYPFGGMELKEEGTYNKAYKTINGCDSIVTLHLTVHPVYSQTIAAEICQGDTYPFAGIERFESGQYQSNLKSINGCDSIIYLNLTVHPVNMLTVEKQICQGSAYSFGGMDRYTSGQYKNTLKSTNGCDSTIILNLTVHPLPELPIITQQSDTLRSSAQEGNQWLKEGVEMEGENKPVLVITRSGNYTVKVTNANGCSASSSIYQAVKTDVHIVQSADFDCHVFPNPNNGLFTVEIESDQSNPLVLELITMEGKSVKRQKLEHPQGKQTIQFGKANLAEGVYTLQIKLGKQIISRRLVIHQ